MDILAALFILGIVLLVASLLVLAITMIIIATYNVWKDSALRNDIVERRRKRHEQYEEQEVEDASTIIQASEDGE